MPYECTRFGQVGSATIHPVLHVMPFRAVRALSNPGMHPDAVAIARASGVRLLEVTANPQAVAFYEKVGFAVRGSASTRFGPGVRMAMDLDQSSNANT